MFQLIVFDWDGTLADSVNKIIACKQFLATKYGLPTPTEETIRSVLGTKFESAMVNCFPTASKKILLKMEKEFNVLMQQKMYQAHLFPYAKETLALLKEQKYKLAIATSKARVELNTALEHNDLTGFFDETCCGEEYGSKPLPTMLNYLIKLFQVSADECLMLGDTLIDILFAKNADVKTICVTFGAHSKEKLEFMNPLALIDDWRQLPKILHQLREKPCSQTHQVYYPL